MRVLLDFPQTYQRVLFAATAFLLLGCGGNGSQQPLPRVKAGGVQVTLPWKDGARIAREYTCDGANRTPAVRVQPSPPGRVAIVMSDPDASGGTFIHWTRWGSSEGRNSFGRTGYDGPCPPKGDSPHHYVVTAYVVRQPLGLPSGADPDKVLAAIRRSASASGQITGLYSR